jgi:hypothetical protein
MICREISARSTAMQHGVLENFNTSCTANAQVMFSTSCTMQPKNKAILQFYERFFRIFPISEPWRYVISPMNFSRSKTEASSLLPHLEEMRRSTPRKVRSEGVAVPPVATEVRENFRANLIYHLYNCTFNSNSHERLLFQPIFKHDQSCILTILRSAHLARPVEC